MLTGSVRGCVGGCVRGYVMKNTVVVGRVLKMTVLIGCEMTLDGEAQGMPV